MGRSPPPAPAVVPRVAGGRMVPNASRWEPAGSPRPWRTTYAARLRGLCTEELVEVCARARPGAPTDPLAATRLALRCLAQRVRDLEGEIALLDAELDPLTEKAAGGSVRRLRAALGGADARGPVNRRHRADHARGGGGGHHHDLLARVRRDTSRCRSSCPGGPSRSGPPPRGSAWPAGKLSSRRTRPQGRTR